jgi:hypothetical protein
VRNGCRAVIAATVVARKCPLRNRHALDADP